ncbi:MAG: DNA mismatch repair endonuclease MutL [Treponema sp.]|jgi:DNA mismatch repair protein MutL|nr:DNA mismatch repair endonuclease MutL [Treponema sp.]
MNRIQILAPEEARRIAAGEVIDRPAALVREFLDNAIDAGSFNIDVSIEEGGSKKVEVSDDGAGMNLEDLQLCWLTHATSKIRGLDDLDTALTLGFRGEALAAAAAVARIEIITSTDGRESWRLEAGPTDSHSTKFEITRRTKGTTVRALNVFDSIPARKRFLKREGSEAVLCRQVFIDKACAFNTINFRFIQDGKLKDFFPAVSSKKKRFAAAFLQSSYGSDNFLHEINVTGENFSAEIVIGGPELYRNDRRQLFVFVNGRRVQEYFLIQAMEYGASGWFPNGTHPVGAVFVEVDPSYADFNIHPAKREVRFRDQGVIHSAVSGGVKNFFHSLFLRTSHKDAETKEYHLNSRQDAETPRTQRNELNFSYNNYEIKQNTNLNEKISNNNFASLRLCEKNIEKPFYEDMRYAGRVFGLFILIEWGNKLYIIDQHAAHERILYDKFLKEPIPKQELLAPIPFLTESSEDDAYLESKKEELSQLGLDIKKDGNDWLIEALPADWRLGDAATVKEILELRTAGENITQRWAATLCCHAAIKDGDSPDDQTAFALGKEALQLPNPHCPHGRPIWTEISKEALYKAVRRE